jgi:hypothetical protein
MSAFICQEKTLQNIVGYLDIDVRFSNTSKCYGSLNRILFKNGFNLEYIEHRDRLIKEMAFLNRLGVNERYNEFEEAEKISYRESFCCSLIQAFKSLSCFLYQCCEGDIPEKNNLYKMLEEIKNEMACCIVSNLPEYEKARWD